MLKTKPKLAYKIALGVEYNGNKYHGWQRQSKVNSIQEELEKALSQIANESITVFCAGRTDAGVHSTGQVVHFKTTAVRKETSWMLGVNTYLPEDIAVRWAKIVSDDFHARFSATARCYRYIICNQKSRPAVLGKRAMHFRDPLDVKLMHSAAQFLIGEHDFTSFSTSCYHSFVPLRNIMYIHVNRSSIYVVIDIKANAFIYHMVRKIVGSLIEVGVRRRPESWIAEILEEKRRVHAIATAKAEGLYLVSVDYPRRYDLPLLPMGPLF